MRWLTLLVLACFLLAGCAPASFTPATTQTVTPPGTSTASVTPAPQPQLYTFRVQLSTTADWSSLRLLNTAPIKTMGIIERQGEFTDFDVRGPNMLIAQSIPNAEGLHQVSVTVEYQIPTSALQSSLHYLLKRSGLNITAVRFYKIEDRKPYLLQQIQRGGIVPTDPANNPYEFSFDLKILLTNVTALPKLATPIPTLSVSYARVTDPSLDSQMSRITSDAVNVDQSVAKWAHAIPACRKPISRNPAGVIFETGGVGVNDGAQFLQAKPRVQNGHTVIPRNEILCGIFKIQMSPKFGLIGKNEVVGFNMMMEDRNGTQADFTLIMGKAGVREMEDLNLFADQTADHYVPVSGINPDMAVRSLFGLKAEGAKANDADDIRALGGDSFYQAQGLSRQQVNALFDDIVKRNAFSESDVQIIERTLWLTIFNVSDGVD